MTKLRARGALRREAAGEGTDFVVAADVNDRALEDRVYREAIDHGFDLSIVERAAIAREEIVDRCTIFEVAFAHSLSFWSGLWADLDGDAVLACLVEQVFEFADRRSGRWARTAGWGGNAKFPICSLACRKLRRVQPLTSRGLI